MDEKTKPKRGRPKAENPLIPVTVWVSPDESKRLDQLARKHEMDVSPIARRIIASRLP